MTALVIFLLFISPTDDKHDNKAKPLSLFNQTKPIEITDLFFKVGLFSDQYFPYLCCFFHQTLIYFYIFVCFSTGDGVPPQQRHCFSREPEVIQLRGGQSICSEDHRLRAPEPADQQLP